MHLSGVRLIMKIFPRKISGDERVSEKCRQIIRVRGLTS